MRKERPGKENLRIPTSEEAREIGSKGGKASADSRRRSKAIKEIFDELLSKNLTEEAADAVYTMIEDEAYKRGQKINAYEAIAIAQIAKAAKGDTAAAQYVRDSVGDKPTDKMELGGEGFDIRVQVIDGSSNNT